ncbi:sensor histidine kinase [Bacteroides fluxus]|jgi:two-component system phosphate regulon sensor histidine kinase PhoR|uniref:histidine kinase n=1 Tax=Bacteroides fluxus YIT 12057 TaxID=763034 RepID=F3PND2_9BACE|nr:HAMP domain-containing sensor histidine kinase [Bacteroides fluxus]EGF59671.1 ATPase/histidine kinase/DNA gyrase B/HSP90 domain protein [Bacteroides fluxus YIT 12057]MDY3789647.1 ATP-binding protein [Bacteroides fluxus]
MKKSTIWILGIVMGLSFLSLLYLQISYIEEMVKMRNEQFDESVKRALMAASKGVESDEVVRWLNEDISEAEKKAWERSQSGNGVLQTQRFVMTAPDGSVRSSIELKTFSNEPSELPRAMISRKHGAKTIPQTSRSQVEMLKHRYLYQRALVDEVVLDMVYNAKDKPISERVNFKNLDQHLKAGLIDNGIDLTYHFRVVDKDGREVYRCSDYSDEGSENSYSQPLFLNDPPARMSIVKIHFPGKRDYIFDSVSFMIPSMIFTLVLLVTFIFTIYIVFRQKKLTEMKNDFINNMTHEFKTPISTISLAAQMLKDPAVGKSPAMFQHISGVINDETKRLRFQVEKVLQMSMFDRQKATLKMKELDANELITGVINTFALKVERYNGKIESELNAADPIIFADEMHITNVIFNLMDNAVKYKRPDADLLLVVKTWNEPGKLMISVQDNGIGIKKENLKKIFEKFYRVHTGNLHDVKGFGLGLAYVRKIIVDHKGTIRAESELNVGTKFIIALPLLKN